MASNIDEEIQELFNYLDISQDSSINTSLDIVEEKPQKWKEKWDYIYQKRPSLDKYRLPSEGGLLSRHHPVSQGGFATPTHPNGHEGFDIANKEGTPVYAIGPGFVKKVYTPQTNKKGGNSVITSHENGKLISYYAHLESVSVTEGQHVDQFTKIGTMGKTGNARGAVHLHWNLKLNGTSVDPNQITNKPVGFVEKEAQRKDRLTKVARRYRLAVWKRLLLQSL